jgi:hypothetical protein
LKESEPDVRTALVYLSPAIRQRLVLGQRGAAFRPGRLRPLVSKPVRNAAGRRRILVIWGSVNFAVGAALLAAFAPKGAGVIGQWALVGLGALIISIFLASHFGRVRAKRG